jgi:hypothetical protein
LRPATRPGAPAPGADSDVSAGGLVRVALPDTPRAVALTCATCHMRVSAERRLIIGAGNDRLDLGRLMNDGLPATHPSLALARAAWGPGRVDVTTPGGGDPLSIPDLRPIKWQSALHHGASLKRTDETALAIRIETLIITAYGGAVRPPREVALGLALYLRSLGDQLPEPPSNDLFAARCAGCHRPPGLSGPAVTQAHGGVDMSHAQSAERGTGGYRVPSLRGVATRGVFFHDGSARSLETVLERAAIPPAERPALRAYLSRL